MALQQGGGIINKGGGDRGTGAICVCKHGGHFWGRRGVPTRNMTPRRFRAPPKSYLPLEESIYRMLTFTRHL